MKIENKVPEESIRQIMLDVNKLIHLSKDAKIDVARAAIYVK